MPEQLKYEEMLRTVGAVLDQTGDDLAVLDVWPHGVMFQSVGRSGRHEMALPEIQRVSQERQALRGTGTSSTPEGLPRFEWVLRVVGAELDRVQQSRFGLTVSRSRVIVEGAEGYQRTFEADELTVLMREAVARRRAQTSVE
ncbi:MAG: hypothetical protein IRZ14_04855 [Chloroflexi bacterium]|nr:hypothetical protein [Chloroflexota bacterium]